MTNPIKYNNEQSIKIRKTSEITRHARIKTKFACACAHHS